ncbi:MAG: hypothetical protein K8U57_06385 [Planctomycetes bacterium]|nr:hypothetical protein [Planctomycetota bacterium]
MRMSRGITVTLLSGLMLTACLTSGGCGRRHADHTWYDAQGHAISENWKTDTSGKQIPDPFPHDRYGRQWVYDANGVLMPLPPPTGYSYHPTYWWWGGSGYRSTSSGTSYRTGSPGAGGPSPSSSSSSSSVSRGGFGSIGLSGG